MAKKKKKATKRRMTARERVRRRLEGGGMDANRGSSDDFIKLDMGRNWIRILPPTKEPDEFTDIFIERRRHFSVGPDNKPMTCPSFPDTSKKCPQCALVRQLYAEGDKAQAGELGARTQYNFNAVKIDPKTGELASSTAKLITLGLKAAKQVFEFYEDDDEHGDPWGEDAGREGIAYDFIIKKVSTGPKQFNVDYIVRDTRKFQSVPNTEELLESLFDLEEYFEVPTEAQALAVFRGVDEDAEDVADDDADDDDDIDDTDDIDDDDDDDDYEEVEVDEDDIEDDDEVIDDDDDDDIDDTDDIDDDDDTDDIDDDDDTDDIDDDDDIDDTDDDDDEPEPEPPPKKKKRGRPPKKDTVVAAKPAPKRRGRPPKNPPKEEAPKKRRGRPPKAAKEAEAPPKRRGRPPKSSSGVGAAMKAGLRTGRKRA